MNIYFMLAIALLAGFVGTGFVWFGWSAVENLIAMRSAAPAEDDASATLLNAGTPESASAMPTEIA